jgi:hypothetical protein
MAFSPQLSTHLASWEYPWKRDWIRLATNLRLLAICFLEWVSVSVSIVAVAVAVAGTNDDDNEDKDGTDTVTNDDEEEDEVVVNGLRNNASSVEVLKWVTMSLYSKGAESLEWKYGYAYGLGSLEFSLSLLKMFVFGDMMWCDVIWLIYDWIYDWILDWIWLYYFWFNLLSRSSDWIGAWRKATVCMYVWPLAIKIWCWVFAFLNGFRLFWNNMI